MFLLLMRSHLLSARNIARDSLRRHPLVTVGLSVLGVLLFALVYLGFLAFLLMARRLGVLEETVYQVFYFLFLFLLAGAVPFVASTLLHSADYALLYSAPVPPRAVIAAKLLDATVTNSLQFTVLGIPAIVACASVLGIPLWSWVLVPILVALFVLLPALITALGLLIALGLFGMPRLRAAIGMLNAVMALVVCITIVLEARHLPIRPETALHHPHASFHAGAFLSRSATAHLAPSASFAAALLGVTKPNGTGLGATALHLGVIVLAVGGLFLLCMALGARLLSAATLAEEGEAGRRTSENGTDEARWWRRFFPAPVAAMILKDFKYLTRDSILLSQLLMPMILFLVPFLLALQDRSVRVREEIYPFAAALTGVILFMQTSILSLSCIGLESKSFWVVLTSPNSGSTLLWAKFVMSTLFSAGSALLLTLISAFWFQVPPMVVLAQAFISTFCAAGLCGLGVGISAALPRFVYTNPAHRVSAWALILGFFATIGYVFLTGAVYGVAWVIVGNTEDIGAGRLFWIGAGLFHLALTGICVAVPLTIGTQRIERYQWEH